MAAHVTLGFLEIIQTIRILLDKPTRQTGGAISSCRVGTISMTEHSTLVAPFVNSGIGQTFAQGALGPCEAGLDVFKEFYQVFGVAPIFLAFR